ncbi:MAG TPA: hypothetical protein VFO98_09495 [Marmoricola sp.]|nr:hypothetical protein [Marmoricola sp.]
MFRRVLRGAAAGAAATTALHAATYLDMAIRGRPASSTPEKTVEAMADSQGVQIPGQGSERENRLAGLGPLSGIVTGVGVGVAYGVMDVLHLRPRGLAGVLFAGGGAMAFSNVTMTKYGVTDPSTWNAEAWVSDLLPHLAYGTVLTSTYSLALDPH